jgi:hypothetical protein
MTNIIYIHTVRRRGGSCMVSARFSVVPEKKTIRKPPTNGAVSFLTVYFGSVKTVEPDRTAGNTTRAARAAATIHLCRPPPKCVCLALDIVMNGKYKLN